MFDFFEKSRWANRKQQLFEFALQDKAWRFTTGDTDKVLNAGTPDERVFLATAISRTAVRESSERAQNNVTITMPYLADPNATDKPNTQDFGDLWRPFPPSGVVVVTCYAYHDDDPDQQIVVEWIGRVAQPRVTDTIMEFVCQPSSNRAQYNGMGRRWQRGCDLVLYSTGLGMCNASLTDNAVPATLSGVTGLLFLTAGAFSASPKSLAGGFIEWTTADGVIERRSIMNHNGNTIEINYGAADLAPGLMLTAYPGCAHNWSACESFDNTDNYGGAIYMNSKNPFGGVPIW